MAFLLVDNDSGVIVNEIVVDATTIASGWQPPAGQTLVSYDGDASIGWRWDGMKAINPNPDPPPEPQATKAVVTN